MALNAEELIATATAALRCIPWCNMSLELMRSSSSAGSDALAVALGAGETLDRFLSHSWHDDAEAKWNVLRQWSQQFFSQNGRAPRLWLDKVCIDQANIGEGLRCLPVNVMACDKVLVCWGSTYPTGRLFWKKPTKATVIL